VSYWLLSTFLILVFVLVGGYFSATEMALVSLRDGQVRRLAEQGPKGEAIARLRSDPSRFLSVAQIGVTSAGFFAAGYGGATLAVDLAGVLRGWGVPDGVAAPAGLVSVTLAVSYVSLVFGELAPKRWAMARPAAVALFAAPVLDRVGRVLRPVIWLLMASADAVVGLLGMDPHARAGGVSEEELRELVGSQPDLTAEERRVLADVFTATDRLVAEVMVPRTEIDFLEGAMTTEEAAAFVVAHPHSRYPVAGRSPDDVVGVVHARDVLGAARRRRLGDTAPATVAAMAGTALAIPDTLPLIEALSRMRRHGRLSVVVDEYGGTAGIVTLKDLVEEMIGEIGTDGDTALPDVDGAVELDGLLHREDVRARTGITLPAGHYDTLAGFVVTRMGHTPRIGDSVVALGCRFTVLETDGHRAALVRVAPDAT
jgi:putative hemolysin